jgi:hypothetical protein
MVSVASAGTAERIAARILFKVLRAGSGTPARYSSTFFGAALAFAAELRLPAFTFFMRTILQKPPLPVHAPDRHELSDVGRQDLFGLVGIHPIARYAVEKIGTNGEW